MDGRDTSKSTLNTSDASRLMRELNVHLNQSNDSSVDGYPGLQNSTDSDMKMSGEGSRAQTLTQLMKTMYDSAPRQQIVLQGNDAANSFSVYGKEVDIFTSANQSSAGSNKVKITPVVNFDWDPKYYIGNLVAVHRDNIFMAYVLKDEDKPARGNFFSSIQKLYRNLFQSSIGKTGGNVRIINRKTAERWLIKCVNGRIVDVAFAHTDAVILAAVDEIGNLLVHEMQEIDGATVNTLILNIQRPDNTVASDYHRIIWCPYIPDDTDDNISEPIDSSKVLVLTHSERAEIWNIDMIIREHGSGPIDPRNIDLGMISIDSHDQPIIDAAFSPDGSALATASLNGEVKFFQVYLYEGTSPRCLHQWKPHDGKPLSCLHFLDDHKNFNMDAQLWKFAITGADKNQELKVWSCETWNCLQTIRFLNPPGINQELSLKATFDLSGHYLALSDINKKVLYILQVHQDTATLTAHVSSISEFILAQPCLSLTILDASKKRFKRSANDTHFDEITTGELGGEDEELEDGVSTACNGVQVRLYSVHTRSLQELLIRYKPESSVPISSPPSVSSVSQDDTGLRDTLSDISMSIDGNSHSLADGDVNNDISKHVLLTPEAFTSLPSPSKTTVDVRGSLSDTSTFTHVTMNDDLVSPRSSTDLSMISPGSTLINTPNSVRDSNLNRSQELTPSSVPLPPVTSCEEDELATPKGSIKSDTADSTQPTNPQLAALEEFFNTKGSTRTIQSFDSTSSTSVYETEMKVKTSRKTDAYDEDDQEVAEVLGICSNTEATIGETGEFSQQEEASEENPIPTAWPQPPDVSAEAKRLVVDTIQQVQNDDDDDDDDEDGNEDEEDDEDDEEEEEIEDIKTDDSPINSTRDTSNEELRQDGSGTYRLESKPQEKIIREVIHETREIVDQTALKDLHDNINLIVQAMKAQQEQITELQKQLINQHDIQVNLQHQQLEHVQLTNQGAPANLEEHLGKVEDVVTSRVERAISTHLQKENQRLKDLIGAMDDRHKKEQKLLHGSIIETVGSSVTKGLDRSVRAEIKQTVLPCVSRTLEPIKEQHHHELAQKLSATDSLLKDNIAKMVRSKQTVEAIGQAAGNAIQAPIQAAYREAFQNMVVPSFERASQNLFKQMNDTFVKGTREYTNHLESHLEQVRKRQSESRDPLLSQLQSMVDSFRSSSESYKSQVLSTVQTELQSHLQTSTETMQERLLQHIRTAVKEEVNFAMREQGASINSQLMNHLRSGAATPIQVSPEFVSSVPTQTSVSHLLHSGKINEAFQQALSASNLELVVFVCQKANMSLVFSTPNVLDQPVLLSLVQQLSADLHSHTELKIKYLGEAIMNLDTKNPVTREHMKSVLYTLLNKLRAFTSNRPNDPISRSVKMLLLATQSLLSS